MATGAESSLEEPERLLDSGLPPVPPRGLWKKTRAPPPPVPPAASPPPVTTDMSPSAEALRVAGRRGGRAPGATTSAARAAAYDGPHLLRALSHWILEEGGGKREEGGDQSLKDAPKDPDAPATETALGLEVVRGGESVPGNRPARGCVVQGEDWRGSSGWQGAVGPLGGRPRLLPCRRELCFSSNLGAHEICRLPQSGSALSHQVKVVGNDRAVGSSHLGSPRMAGSVSSPLLRPHPAAPNTHSYSRHDHHRCHFLCQIGKKIDEAMLEQSGNHRA